jgi:hypothetical protein
VHPQAPGNLRDRILPRALHPHRLIPKLWRPLRRTTHNADLLSTALAANYRSVNQAGSRSISAKAREILLDRIADPDFTSDEGGIAYRWIVVKPNLPAEQRPGATDWEAIDQEGLAEELTDDTRARVRDAIAAADAEAAAPPVEA